MRSDATAKRTKSHERWNKTQLKKGKEAPKEKVPLEWKEVHAAQRGNVKVVVTAANGDTRTFYSIRLGRQSGDKVTGYFRADDMDDLESILEDVRGFIAAQQN